MSMTFVLAMTICCIVTIEVRRGQTSEALCRRIARKLSQRLCIVLVATQVLFIWDTVFLCSAFTKSNCICWADTCRDIFVFVHEVANVYYSNCETLFSSHNIANDPQYCLLFCVGLCAWFGRTLHGTSYLHNVVNVHCLICD